MAVNKGTFDSVLAGKKRSKLKAQGSKTTILLADILDRPHGDTRPLNLDHVAELAESIAAVGLIQPLAIDSQGHLLAGGHRRAALAKLQDNDPDRYAELFGSGVPVRRFEFSAADDAEQAIAIEAAENEKRRDYTPAEVRELADRLVEAGYRNTGGKPKRGQKALKPALALIIGKSQRTVARYLNQPDTMTPVMVSTEEKTARQLEKLAEKHPAIARKLRNAAKALRDLD